VNPQLLEVIKEIYSNAEVQSVFEKAEIEDELSEVFAFHLPFDLLMFAADARAPALSVVRSRNADFRHSLLCTFGASNLLRSKRNDNFVRHSRLLMTGFGFRCTRESCSIPVPPALTCTVSNHSLCLTCPSQLLFVL
jgi:hypothetical protein